MSWLSDTVRRNIPEDLNPFDDVADNIKKVVKDAAEDAAVKYQSENTNGDYDDCVIIVAT